ncbi:hypothetical protein IGI04_013880 [Brassica rapa subsp. trilocularis]|uniref:Uncharacterized protein n=1 Tax=Brassica rapa subsp. trilocularis TaxID=1813537 RepID=A0ABQ7NA23_BRACM|nr:hypothetical protein IGI04_013880 [Brassica rapa subsp. trilocularis]
MAATKIFFRSGFEVEMTSMKSRRLRGSLPDEFQEEFQEVVWSSGLHGSLLTKSPFHNRSERLGFSDLDLICRRLNFQSSQKTDFKVNCKNNLCVDQTTFRLLQAHRISNESDSPIIVSFYDFMNHKKCKIKISEWKKKKGNSILGALRASNWLFMVVRVLMTMTIL